jgi:hypothetical protein
MSQYIAGSNENDRDGAAAGDHGFDRPPATSTLRRSISPPLDTCFRRFAPAGNVRQRAR